MPTFAPVLRLDVDEDGGLENDGGLVLFRSGRAEVSLGLRLL
jgi:hypothetical protein